ncbi:hypothetical protein MLD38_021926 [Melastoma candidum]|uniref:Uncharacterized protein n=1 Tax=Melastoma candidum TaxID=119954 RepID=A0ACB9QHM6_9MYRT|nr:hypothetical protein MLD38_021926 [Melastoma candidum]
MDLSPHSHPLPLIPSSSYSNRHWQLPRPSSIPVRFLRPPPLTTSTKRRPSFRFIIRSSSNPDSPGGSPWQRLSLSLTRVSRLFWLKFLDSASKNSPFDSQAVSSLLGDLPRFNADLLPAFIRWNQWERWKDLNSWDFKRIGASILYALLVVVACRRCFTALRAPFLDRQRKELTEAYMEALIPEPSPANVRRFKKGVWRKNIPKGLKMKKFVEGPNGTIIHDQSFVGEDAWDDDDYSPHENIKQMIACDSKLKSEDKKKLMNELGVSAEVKEDSDTWRQRLSKWQKILEQEKLSEQLDSLKAKYVLEFDMQEVENSLRRDIIEKASDMQSTRALWISKRWWRYRPKLPYTYFLEKLDHSEVAAVVFTEDLKRLYVTMKEGFPLEYIVDIPLDPYLFEIISSSGVDVDLLQRRQIHYFLKVLFALLPGILTLWIIRETAMLLLVTSKRFLYKKYNQLFDMAYAENFILPVGNIGETKSTYKEVVLGGDVWDLLDELMIYMGNPMQYYEKGVKFVRGVLLSGPPGTGKTLFARTLAKESGLPFVFASGAEFTDSEKSGAARINEMFSIARRNAPSFVFVDEVDAIAGRHARKDPRRRATFEALIAQLDGEKEKTGVDRFSLRQAVIFICATNRPDELDLEFVRPGRIDRRLYIGLPDAKQREQIFAVHSMGKQLSDDVNFGKLVFRTVGFSGADIRNLVNESAIMSVRKGHPKIYQQDIVDVLDKQLLEGMGVLLTEEEQQKCKESVSLEKKKLLAIHEAGHIVLAHLFPRFDWHAFSQLLPGGKETAISVFYPREDMVDQGYTTFGYMKMQMVVAHGGRCAERVVFGDDITDGGKDDLERITRIAREMVISPQNSRLGVASLTKRVGLLDRPDNPDGELIKYRWDDPHVIPADMSLELSELFSRELNRFIEETEGLALKGLMDNRHVLDAIAEKLLENSRITGLEVEEMMKEMQISMFRDLAEPYQVNLEKDVPRPLNKKMRYMPLDIYPAPLHRC